MERISREHVERLVKRDGRTVELVDITYFGRETRVQYKNLNQVNWDNVKKCTVKFVESRPTYIGFDEGSECPIFTDRRRIRVRTRPRNKK